MKKSILIALSVLTITPLFFVMAQTQPFNSRQLAPSPSNGNCLITNGSINSWSSLCGGGGASFPFTPTTNFNQAANSTSTQIWFRGSPISLSASSTSQFSYATTTQLTVNDYLKIGNVISLQPNSFGTGFSEAQIDKNINDGVGMNIFNRSTGSQAISYFALNNANTTLGGPGALAKYTADWVMGGSNWNGVPLGFGSLGANDSALYVTDGNLIFGAPTSSPSHNVGNVKFFGGFTGSFNSGIPDAILSDLGYWGVGTSTPGLPLSIVGDAYITGRTTGSFFVATSTVASNIFPYASTTAVSVSSLTSGNCVQAGTGGLLTTVGSACGSGEGGVGWASTTAIFGQSNAAIQTTATSIGIGTSTPWNNAWFTVATSTGVDLRFSNLLSGSNLTHWNIYQTGTSLMFGTSSPSTGATSTPSLQILPSSGPFLSVATSTQTGTLNLGNNPSTTNGSTTIFMNKLQWDGYDSGGTRRCTFINSSGSLTTISGACNN